MDLIAALTFGGSDLDRAHHLRAHDALHSLPGAGVIAIWRGKPLVRDGHGAGLLRLWPGHPVLAGLDLMLLGLVDGAAVLMADLPDWPEAGDAPADGFLDQTEQRHPELPDGHFAELRSVMTLLSPVDAELAATARALAGWHQTNGYCARCGKPSVMALAGWQRDCPACGAHHFPRTDPVVIMLITHGNDVLLGRSPGWPEGMFSLLAGFIEPGETVEAAVRREVREEAGVIVGPVSYVASQPWPFPASLMLGCQGHAVKPTITIDPSEIEAALWVSRERMARIMAGNDPDIRAPRRGAIAQYLLQFWLQDRLTPP